MTVTDAQNVVHSPGSEQPILSIQNLAITFDTMKGKVNAIRNVSLDLYPGEILGIIGETGSGKSVTCKAITRILPKETIIQGKILFKNQDLVTLPLKELRAYRGKAISMIFQDPMSNLDQIRTIFAHMREVTVGATKQEKRKIDGEKLSSLHIKHATQRIDDYPFQFSGGMAQRVQIAMALLGNPQILVADEPTTALDVTIQDTILKEFKNLSQTKKLSIILVTHDFGVVSEICDRVAVMYHGTIVECGKVSDIIAQPFHPYTHALLQSVPSLESFKYVLTPIQGDCLASEVEVQGCDFASRCPFADERCRTEKPDTKLFQNRYINCFHPILTSLKSLEKVMRKQVMQSTFKIPAIEVKNLGCIFDTKNELGDIVHFHAVNTVSFQLHKGEIFGIVGESGSGKSTIAKAIMGITPLDEGSVSCLGIENDGSAVVDERTLYEGAICFSGPSGSSGSTPCYH
ncbi:oligopeptide/dipeptide ABC transporter ATP-binding protein [uncultured Sphaerochaeta sp.]|uniref:oligopeptide/dipeptide ABC transporter ATP-binding protein n=1 Tax=uncultured Sphaerochaeta sp. TaxID=886478 RepID=UPI002A0A970E|nr:oligopeptide/dipeptide ABC transporter ATP-binding protein [uncultured Sphaerochaeta sp.]